MEKKFISEYFNPSLDCQWICTFFVSRAFIRTSVEQGLTGNITFNNEGDRIESLYEILNIQYGEMKVVGTYRSNAVSQTSSHPHKKTHIKPLFSHISTVVPRAVCAEQL